MSITNATLRLFNAIQVTEKSTYTYSPTILSRMIKNGYIVDFSINATSSLMNQIEEVIGIGGEKLNSSFHKSWEKVARASYAQLFVEQIIHYITTYGFERIGVYNEKFVYIPHESLDIPEITEDIPLVFVRGMDSEELLSEIITLGSTGIALSKETIDDIMTIVVENGYEQFFVSQITNRELYSKLCVHYDIVPSEPVQYLRYLVNKLTGDSLLIKNKYLITKILTSDSKTLDALLKKAPYDLASIFFRYKPLFLAMKSISKNKTFFNQLRKKANEMHRPMSVDYLNDVTNQLKNDRLKIREFKTNIENYSIWRKIRLAYALSNRLVNNGSVVYKIRNGKGWATDFSWDADESKLEQTLHYTLRSIAASMKEEVDGKTFLIPSHIHYALPATEKQFVGNIPSNTSVSVKDNVIVGIHWYNHKNNGRHSNKNDYFDDYDFRVDLDLSLLDVNGKFGWDRSWRSSNRDIMFSGDMTDAPRPHGASEFFYMRQGVSESKLINVNYFTFRENTPVDFQLIIARENISRNGFGERKGYMINPNNILMSQSMTIDKTGNTIGYVMNAGNETRVYLSNVSIANSITSRNNDASRKALQFFENTMLNTIDLEVLINMAGGTVIHEVPEDNVEYVNLSPEALDKNTIIGLFAE